MKIENIGVETVQKKCLNPILFRDVLARGVGGCKSPHLFYVGTARGHLQKIGKSRDGIVNIEFCDTMVLKNIIEKREQ